MDIIISRSEQNGSGVRVAGKSRSMRIDGGRSGDVAAVSVA